VSVSWPEIERLYRQHAPRLQRTVRGGVRAPHATIEDACQTAWGQLMDHREHVGMDAALPWLARTAVREARRLSRQDGRSASLEAFGGDEPDPWTPSVHLEDDWIEHLARLCALRALPVRQRRLMWLQGLGLSYAEMAAHERCTRRTVERQIMRAKRAAEVGL
jgi:RNA polymerase sigma factor (sigma-70 family)